MLLLCVALNRTVGKPNQTSQLLHLKWRLSYVTIQAKKQMNKTKAIKLGKYISMNCLHWELNCLHLEVIFKKS